VKRKPEKTKTTKVKKATLLLALLGTLSACTTTPATSPTTNVAFDGERPQRSFRFDYKADLAAEAADEQLRLWLPLPSNTPDQQIGELTIEASHPYEIKDLIEGNGRSLYMESTGEDLSIAVHFDVTRHATAGGGSASATEIAMGLRGANMIPLGGKVAAVSASIKVNKNDTTMGVAKSLYDHTLERMNYAKPLNGDWGRGDAEWACDSRHGNCTDFHSYFMGLAQTRDIPARFVMGFPISGAGETAGSTDKVGGYHCWAYFYDTQEGWRPVDISEADKHPDKSEFFFGNLDENRLEMIGGRDVLLSPAPAAGRLNLFIYPYAESNGFSTSRVQKAFQRTNL
jgi:hypothetical protein